MKLYCIIKVLDKHEVDGRH